ncbi:protease complex subunit PrcB family protein [Planctomycetota bacterium]|nr:protease complex subunit PrcB family protein [Planctomycetota bacterium]
MLKRFASVLVVAVLAGGFVAGCANNQKAVKGPEHSMSEPVAIKKAQAGSDAALTSAGVQVVNSDVEMNELGADLAALKPNFDEESVVILSLGEKNTGGYWVEITGVQQVGETLYVQGRANQPGENEIVTEAIEYPYAAVVIEKVEPASVIPDLDQVEGQSK